MYATNPSLMRSLLGLLLVALCASTQAQLRFDVYSQNHYNISDYSGLLTQDGNHRFHFQYNGTYLNQPQWSLKVRLRGPILPESGNSVSGLPFPPEKISFRFTHDDGNPPTLGQIGANTGFMPLNGLGETPLINGSNAPIFYESQYNGHFQFNLYFALKFEGGAYLDQYKNAAMYQIIVYTIPLRYSFYNQQGQEIGYKDIDYRMQINYQLSGAPIEPAFGIEIIQDARNATLAFIDLADYLNGVQLTHSNALKINAATAYEVLIKAIHPHFSNNRGDMIDVSILQLQLLPGLQVAQTTQNPALPLTDFFQSYIISGQSPNPVNYYDSKYTIQAGEEKIYRARSGSYNTSIVFQLIPR